MFKQLATQILLLLVTVGTVLAAPHLELGPVSENATTVTMPVTLTNEPGNSIVAVGVDIFYDGATLEKPAAVAGPATLAAEKSVTVSTPSPGRGRVGILGYNTLAIGNGIVAIITFTKRPAAQKEAIEFTYTVSAADPSGVDVTLATPEGKLLVK